MTKNEKALLLAARKTIEMKWLHFQEKPWHACLPPGHCHIHDLARAVEAYK